MDVAYVGSRRNEVPVGRRISPREDHGHTDVAAMGFDVWYASVSWVTAAWRVMNEAFIVAGCRTPVGRYGGALRHVRPDDLAALVVREAVTRAGVDPDLVDEVIFGVANQAGKNNRNAARMALLLAGLPTTAPGFTVKRLCASGMTAVATARQMITAGDADVVVAGRS